MYPKIYLAIDNCFASKRWTTPDQWAEVISNLGVRYIECSADTELDPLYMGKSYLKDWPAAVREAEARYGVQACNLYSGHGTYATLGLAHTDERVRRNMVEQWFKPLIDTASALGTGFGFFAHCFQAEIVEDPEAYAAYSRILEDALVELNCYAKEKGCGPLALEQMYSPNQIPWTIDGTAQLLKRITQRSGHPFYFTEDVGHHQKKFIKPTRQTITDGFLQGNRNLWLGSADAYRIYDHAISSGILSETDTDEILRLVEQAPHLFAQQRDSDCYAWLRALGCYAPIVHLQQTDGVSSEHRAFTKANNLNGIVRGDAILRAIQESYDQTVDEEMPSRCEAIYLTLELFSGTAQTTREILDAYATTVRYWRQFVPEDGLPLDYLVDRLSLAQAE